MSESKHTPGPWNAYLSFADNAPNYWTVSTKAFKGTVTATCNNEENARLIAAAPELLEACKRAFQLIKESGFVSGLIEEEFDATMLQLDNAIAKAEGTKV